MDTLSIGTALLAWRREFYNPLLLLDDDLRAIYEHRRSLQADRARSRSGSIGKELAQGVTHFRAALRIALSGLATG